MSLNPKIHLVGCGILRKEIHFLLQDFPAEFRQIYYDSALHCDMTQLSKVLHATLSKHSPSQTMIFYGNCHPQIDEWLEQKSMRRIPGQNCVSMLLGYDLFMQKLSQGSFFLLEDWAQRWQEIVFKTMGTHKTSLIQKFYQEHHTHLLALRTPCSGNYEIEAEEAAELVGLPLEWMDVDLDLFKNLLWQSLHSMLDQHSQAAHSSM